METPISSKRLFILIVTSLALFAPAGPALAQGGGQSYHPKYKIVIRGGDEQSFAPVIAGVPVGEPETFDVVVVGAGLAGLSAAVFLSDHNRKVLILEKESDLGGLAAGGQITSRLRYDRGAAYWTDTYPEEQAILEHIGLGNFRKKYPIVEPADSFYWNGQFYPGIWEKETLEKLPASFSAFRFMLKRADEKAMIPNQPIEDAADTSLDELTAAEWIRIMPTRLREEAAAGNEEAKLLAERMAADPKVNPADPMGDVLGLMDLYCRSALGTTADQVSAIAFANFYISEIDTRYTTEEGTAGASVNMVKMLRERTKHVTIRAQSTVTHIRNFDDHASVTYTHMNSLHEVNTKYVIFAAQLKSAPRVIDGLAGTEQGAYMEGLSYADYSVHDVFVKGHPFRATYDTWVRPKDYKDDDFTDVILGRWNDPKIHGYEGLREQKANGSYKKNPSDDIGIFTIYHPLPPKMVGTGYTDEQAMRIAESAVDHLLALWPPTMDGKKIGTKIIVKSVESNRWPFSVHVAKPGHFKRAKVMRKPFKRVFFGNNNLGTPAFEEALFRGHCAANQVLELLDKDFEYEKWTKCPTVDNLGD